MQDPVRMQDVKKFSIKELEVYLEKAAFESRGYQLAHCELLRRQSKPHWSTMPAFILLLASVVLSALAYFQPFESDQKSDAKTTNDQPVAESANQTK